MNDSERDELLIRMDERVHKLFEANNAQDDEIGQQEAELGEQSARITSLESSRTFLSGSAAVIMALGFAFKKFILGHIN